MSIFTKVMVQAGLVERRKDGRGPAYGLQVLCGPEQQQQEVPVRDISPTGIFLLTQEQLQPGTQAMLTLGRKQFSDGGTSLRVQLRARAVRQDGQGVGFSFEPSASEEGLWLKLMVRAAPLAAPNDPLDRFRIAKALSFLAKIAAPVQDEIAELMAGAMTRERRERLLAMVLGVEERLEREQRRIRTGISPQLVRDALLYGSAAEDQLTRSYWAQLLTTSCFPVYRDDENLRMAEILSNLLPVHLEIFSAACELTIGGGKWSDAGELHCTIEEIREIAHTPNLNVIDQHLTHLGELGLLGRTLRPRKGEQINHANLTVTMLGVELYARCSTSAARQTEAACG